MTRAVRAPAPHVAPEPTGTTVEFRVHLRAGNRGSRRLQEGREPVTQPVEAGSIPRISRLMALAIRFDGFVRAGAVRDYAELARLGHVTRARVSQVMNLLNLAPDIQEELLFLPRTIKGKDPISERQVRAVVATVEWGEQRTIFRKLKTGLIGGLS